MEHQPITTQLTQGSVKIAAMEMKENIRSMRERQAATMERRKRQNLMAQKRKSGLVEIKNQQSPSRQNMMQNENNGFQMREKHAYLETHETFISKNKGHFGEEPAQNCGPFKTLGLLTRSQSKFTQPRDIGWGNTFESASKRSHDDYNPQRRKTEFSGVKKHDYRFVSARNDTSNQDMMWPKTPRDIDGGSEMGVITRGRERKLNENEENYRFANKPIWVKVSASTHKMGSASPKKQRSNRFMDRERAERIRKLLEGKIIPLKSDRKKTPSARGLTPLGGNKKSASRFCLSSHKRRTPLRQTEQAWSHVKNTVSQDEQNEDEAGQMCVRALQFEEEDIEKDDDTEPLSNLSITPVLQNASVLKGPYNLQSNKISQPLLRQPTETFKNQGKNDTKGREINRRATFCPSINSVFSSSQDISPGSLRNGKLRNPTASQNQTLTSDKVSREAKRKSVGSAKKRPTMVVTRRRSGVPQNSRTPRRSGGLNPRTPRRNVDTLNQLTPSTKKQKGSTSSVSANKAISVSKIPKPPGQKSTGRQAQRRSLATGSQKILNTCEKSGSTQRRSLAYTGSQKILTSEKSGTSRQRRSLAYPESQKILKCEKSGRKEKSQNALESIVETDTQKIPDIVVVPAGEVEMEGENNVDSKLEIEEENKKVEFGIQVENKNVDVATNTTPKLSSWTPQIEEDVEKLVEEVESIQAEARLVSERTIARRNMMQESRLLESLTTTLSPLRRLKAWLTERKEQETIGQEATQDDMECSATEENESLMRGGGNESPLEDIVEENDSLMRGAAEENESPTKGGENENPLEDIVEENDGTLKETVESFYVTPDDSMQECSSLNTTNIHNNSTMQWSHIKFDNQFLQTPNVATKKNPSRTLIENLDEKKGEEKDEDEEKNEDVEKEEEDKLFYRVKSFQDEGPQSPFTRMVGDCERPSLAPLLTPHSRKNVSMLKMSLKKQLDDLYN